MVTRDARAPGRWRRRRPRARAYPVAIRSAGDPAQAHKAVLRLRASLRGLRAEAQARARLLRAAGAGRRRDRRGRRSQDRSAEPQVAGAAVDLGRRRRQARQRQRTERAEAADRGRAWTLRGVSARGVSLWSFPRTREPTTPVSIG